jgi:hypothetical protein
LISYILRRDKKEDRKRRESDRDGEGDRKKGRKKEVKRDRGRDRRRDRRRDSCRRIKGSFYRNSSHTPQAFHNMNSFLTLRFTHTQLTHVSGLTHHCSLRPQLSLPSSHTPRHSHA